jgi:hypothetical protein
MTSLDSSPRGAEGKLTFWPAVFLALLVAATALLLLGLSRGMAVGVRDEWQWRTHATTVLLPALVAGPLVALVAAALLLLRSGFWEGRGRAAKAGYLVLLVLLIWAFQIGVLSFAPDRTAPNPVISAGALVISPVATTYFSASLESRQLGSLLSNYTTLLPWFPYHAQTHPPGAMAFFWLIDRGVRNSARLQAAGDALLRRLTGRGSDDLAVLYNGAFGAYYAGRTHVRVAAPDALAAILSAYLLPLLGALAAFPLYRLASLLAGPRVAVRSVVLFAAIPALSLFAPGIDQVLVPITALLLYLWALQLRRESLWLGLLIGIVYGVGLFISLGLLALAPLLALWTLLRPATGESVTGRQAWSTLGRSILAVSVGLAVFFTLLYAVWGFNMIEVGEFLLRSHRGTTLEASPRSYWPWVIHDPIEFSFFLGVPLVLWLIAALFSPSGKQGRPGALAALLYGWAITVVLLDVSGLVRGEVGRIWLFLMAPAAVFAAGAIEHFPRRDLAVTITLVLLLFQAVAMRASLQLFNLY